MRHQYSTDDNTKQFSAVDLLNEVNSLPFNEIIRIHDIAILQQGLIEFKTILPKLYTPLRVNSTTKKRRAVNDSVWGLGR